MAKYFNINYEFDRDTVHSTIASTIETGKSGYICVADGVVLDNANRNPDYMKVVNGSLFSVCDSSYVPLYIRLIYGYRFEQYCGSQIFRDIIESRRYRMFFMGTSAQTLAALRNNIMHWNPDVENMTFYELPYRDVEDFDYEEIARTIERDGAQIVWVALGAPKQEIFMSKLKPHLKKGVMIAVGAAFKFFSGVKMKRAPEWMVKSHTEFLYRLAKEPKKQFARCSSIVGSLPRLLVGEWKRKRTALR